MSRTWRRKSAPKILSRSRSRYRGISSKGNASRTCCAVHSAVGWAVTLKWTTRRRSCANTRNTYSTWKRIVGTVKKSTETSVRTWLSRKVRQVCEGGLRRRTMYFATLVSPMAMPNEQLTMDVGSTPERIFTAHPADQIADFVGNNRPAGLTAAYFPGPEQAKAPAVPRDDCLRPDDGQR